MKKLTMMIAGMALAAASQLNAMTTPFEISLVCEPLDIPWCQDVSGLRLNLLSGINRNVSGLDIGTLANITDERGTGLALCGFYNRVGEGYGLVQCAGLMNRCDQDLRGVQIAGIYNEIGGKLTGGACALLNQSKEMSGLQLGLFNTTDTLVGMQIGLVNYADNTEKGVQVGLVNVMPTAELPVNVIVNIGF